MKTAIFLIVLFSFAGRVHARIGETPAQTAERYGPVIEHGVTPFRVLPTFVVDTHRKNGLTLHVHYSNGKADWIRISKDGGDHQFTDAEVSLLLAADSGGKSWQILTRGSQGDDLRLACSRTGVMMHYRAEKDQPPFLEFVTSATLDTLVGELEKRGKALEAMRFDETRERLNGF